MIFLHISCIIEISDGRRMKGEDAVRRKDLRRGCMIVGVTALALLSAGCGSRQSAGKGSQMQEEVSPAPEESFITLPYNTVIKAVVMKLDVMAGVIQLQNTAGGLSYTLTFGSGVNVVDKYGSLRVMDEVKAGDVVEAYIDDTNGSLAGICYSKENWKYENCSNWKFDTEKSELTIGKDKYYYDELVLLSDGEEISLMDLNQSDVLNIYGNGKKVLSASVEQGHGYVKLQGVSDFVGGWVEIGRVIKPVSEDMLIVVPEGNWDVKIAKDGYGGSLAVKIGRNEETVADFSDISSSIVRYGAVEFTIEPEDARLYIAGREMDYSKQILLEYDTYKIRVSADGYEDYTGELKVSKALTGKKITLEKEGSSETTDTAVSASPSPSPTAAATVVEAQASPSPSADVETMSDYKIQVTAPEGVNVYFDDLYVGVSPVSITKKTGEHTVTLSKAGYVTRSYTVEVGSEEKDVTFQLPELEHQE